MAHARAAFGWDGDIGVSAGPRGALGQIWRLEIGSARYALKQIFAEPPTEASIRAELAFARRAGESRRARPASHPDREGRYLLTAPEGTWLRCYDWVDLRPVALTAPDTARRARRAARPLAPVRPGCGGRAERRRTTRPLVRPRAAGGVRGRPSSRRARPGPRDSPTG